jgi:fermentation-respiration switch protein FrsA (DUF1100 family)
MPLLKVLAFVIVVLYFAVILLLYIFQTRLIFYPGKLPKDFKFMLGENDQELFLETADHEAINALFFPGTRAEVILYFHGNAGDLSGWQFVAEDFTAHGYNFLIIDYRGYGKSSGTISEDGFYRDAEAAYMFLLQEKGFTPQDIIIYGRSVGSGVAVDLAGKHKTRGLILESPYASLKKLANEKLPFLFPSLYLLLSFNNIQKIKNVDSPVILLHGSIDTLIPASHSERLFKKIQSKKKMILIPGGSHNDLNAFQEYDFFLEEELPAFF